MKPWLIYTLTVLLFASLIIAAASRRQIAQDARANTISIQLQLDTMQADLNLERENTRRLLCRFRVEPGDGTCADPKTPD